MVTIASTKKTWGYLATLAYFGYNDYKHSLRPHPTTDGRWQVHLHDDIGWDSCAFPLWLVANTFPANAQRWLHEFIGTSADRRYAFAKIVRDIMITNG